MYNSAVEPENTDRAGCPIGSGFHEWDKLGGHCVNCGACDQYLGPHDHTRSKEHTKKDPVIPDAHGMTRTDLDKLLGHSVNFQEAPASELNFRGFPEVPAPPKSTLDDEIISFGLRGDGTWGPITRPRVASQR
jgi:hypothetical protein